ncbi:hypothetical protein FACS1894111_11040 [Clostridia bacterium]|nr:hypothetical protein FACS1894111_11040 [Clostridia bacterium]
MSYTALYRKFRPAEFEDVKGQDAIVTTLKNQIKANRIGHAYLFCGTRGTGKTTIAKIFAKAVNCEEPVDGSPCGACSSCKNIQGGVSMNVIEIDAASNNGVDNIREIREEVAYSPSEGKYKVYIIDEVHMLSIGAFNALLKTLEEPPSYVIFLLATTEANKIPVTILSRCQRYDFRRITPEVIFKRLEELTKTEGVLAEERALRYVAKAADGSMRDALSLLDQCIAFFLGKELSYDNVLEVLGAMDTEVFGHVLGSIMAKDVTGLIALLDDFILQGKEPAQFVSDFTWYLRNLLLIQNADQSADLLDVSTENKKQLEIDAKLVTAEELMWQIRVFSELSNQLRHAVQKRILIEIALIKLCRPQMEQNLESLLVRMANLEKIAEQGGIQGIAPSPGMATGTGVETAETPSKQKQNQGAEGAAPLPKAIPKDVEEAVRNWRVMLSELPGLLHNYLKHAVLSLGRENQLLIVLEDEMAEAYVNTPEHKAEIKRLLAGRIGKDIEIQIRLAKQGKDQEESYVDIEQLINMELTVE